MCLVFSSCNYKFMVSKDRVYNTREGYLVFFNRQKIFIPKKEIDKNDLFKSKFKRAGYLVEFEKEENVLYQIAKKYIIDYEYVNENRSVFVRDTIRVLPVKVGSIPYKYKIKRGKEGILSIRYNNTLFKVAYFSTNNEAVWSVSPLLSDDIKEASRFYQ